MWTNGRVLVSEVKIVEMSSANLNYLRLPIAEKLWFTNTMAYIHATVQRIVITLLSYVSWKMCACRRVDNVSLFEWDSILGVFWVQNTETYISNYHSQIEYGTNSVEY